MSLLIYPKIIERISILINMCTGDEVVVMTRRIKILLIILAILILAFGTFLIARNIVNAGYNSRELVEAEETISEPETKENIKISENEGYTPKESNEEYWKGSIDSTIKQACKNMLSKSPYPELANQVDSAKLSNSSSGDYEIKVGDYFIGFYKDSLAFRYIKKSTDFTQEEVKWLSPDGNTQWFSKEEGYYVYR